MRNRFVPLAVLARLVHLQAKILPPCAFLVHHQAPTRLQALRLALLRAVQAAHTILQALHLPVPLV